MKFLKSLILGSLLALQLSHLVYAVGDPNQQQIVPYAGATDPAYERALMIKQERDAAEKQLFEKLKASILYGGEHNRRLDLIRIPEDVLKVLFEYLDLKELLALSQVSHGIHKNAGLQPAIQKARARAKIEKIVGKLIRVERGAFSYPDDTVNPPVEKWVVVKQDFEMPKTDTSQEQYDWIAALINASLQEGEERMPTAAEAMNPDGSTPNFVGPRKPMAGLNVAQWERYLKKLNEVLAPLWKKAYPGQAAPVFRIPEESELRLAMSNPLVKPKVGEFPLHDEGVPINSEFSTYSGTNVPARWGTLLTFEQEEELRRFVVYGRSWNEGPANVDQGEANARGFIYLSGNIYKLTKTLYDETGVILAILSGLWIDPRQGCRVAHRLDVPPVDASQGVGLRPVWRVQ